MAVAGRLELARDWVSSAPSAFRGSTPLVPPPAAHRIYASLALMEGPAPRALRRPQGRGREPVPLGGRRSRRVHRAGHWPPRVPAGGGGGGGAPPPPGNPRPNAPP